MHNYTDVVRKAADEDTVASQLTEICSVQLQYLGRYHVLLSQRLLHSPSDGLFMGPFS